MDLPQLSLRAQLSCECEADSIPLHNLAILAAHCGDARLDPAIDAVEAPLPVRQCIGSAGLERVIEALIHLVEIVGMNDGAQDALEACLAGKEIGRAHV